MGHLCRPIALIARSYEINSSTAQRWVRDYNNSRKLPFDFPRERRAGSKSRLNGVHAQFLKAKLDTYCKQVESIWYLTYRRVLKTLYSTSPPWATSWALSSTILTSEIEKNHLFEIQTAWSRKDLNALVSKIATSQIVSLSMKLASNVYQRRSMGGRRGVRRLYTKRKQWILKTDPSTSNFEPFILDVIKALDQYAAFRNRYLVMDNASNHMNPSIVRIIQSKGYRVQYLPPYSPDVNSIECFCSWRQERYPENIKLVRD